MIHTVKRQRDTGVRGDGRTTTEVERGCSKQPYFFVVAVAAVVKPDAPAIAVQQQPSRYFGVLIGHRSA
jgi:hypothetical protein